MQDSHGDRCRIRWRLSNRSLTSGAALFLAGPNIFAPITRLCNKEGAVSHSSSEAEIIALDADIRMEGFPALVLSGQVIELFSNENNRKIGKILAAKTGRRPAIVHQTGKAQLLIMEDKEAVIKITIKARSPSLRHCLRTHRVDLDFIFLNSLRTI